MRKFLFFFAILLPTFAAVFMGLVEGGNVSVQIMPFIVVAYLLGLGIWVWLTMTARNWGSRLGGYIVITVGSVILYFFIRANL